MKIYLFLLLLFASLNAFSQQALTDSLNAYYPFSGNANDASGNGNNGTPNGATLTTDRFGNPNSAYYFDGTSSIITYLSNKNFKPATFPISITAWIKPNLSGGNAKIFDNNHTVDTYGGVDLTIGYISGSSGVLSVNYGDGGPTTVNDRRDKVATLNINDNQWHFVAGVIRGPTDMDLYVDCDYVSSTYSGNGSFLGYTNTGGLSGSNNASSNTVYYAGSFDEIRLYHRELSKTDLQQIYSYPRPFNSLSVSLGPDKVINCNGTTSVNLVPSVTGSPISYIWSNNSTTSGILATQPGNYAVTVYDGCRFSSDTIDIVSGGFTQPPVITSSLDSICAESGLVSTLTLNDSAGALQWESSSDQVHFSLINGATNLKYNTSSNLSQSTFYRVYVKNNVCTDTSNIIAVNIIPAPVAAFTYLVNGKQVSFALKDTSSDIILYSWDFGDSSVSHLANPTHLFTAGDTFFVCLTVYNGANCSYTYCRDVDLLTGIDNVYKDNLIQLFPNPANNTIAFSVEQANGEYQLKIYDVLGQEIESLNSLSLHNKQPVSISLDNLPAGAYQLVLYNKKEIFGKRFVHYK